MEYTKKELEFQIVQPNGVDFVIETDGQSIASVVDSSKTTEFNIVEPTSFDIVIDKDSELASSMNIPERLFIKGDPGEPGKDGKDGKDGEDGGNGIYIGPEEPTDEDVEIWIDEDGTDYAPSVTVEQVAGGAKITVTDYNGSTTATITNGLPYNIGNGLKVVDNSTLEVDTVDSVMQDNTKPITSAAVFAEIGNIEVLLQTI